jgi:hypothetical protein
MRGLKINKQTSGRDYPLSATPEPVGMQQERERKAIESISSLRLMQEKRAKEKDSTKQDAMKQDAMKGAAERLKNNQI